MPIGGGKTGMPGPPMKGGTFVKGGLLPKGGPFPKFISAFQDEWM